MSVVEELRTLGREAERKNPSLFETVNMEYVYRGKTLKLAATMIDDMEFIGLREKELDEEVAAILEIAYKEQS